MRDSRFRPRQLAPLHRGHLELDATVLHPSASLPMVASSTARVVVTRCRISPVCRVVRFIRPTLSTQAVPSATGIVPSSVVATASTHGVVACKLPTVRRVFGRLARFDPKARGHVERERCREDVRECGNADAHRLHTERETPRLWLRATTLVQRRRRWRLKLLALPARARARFSAELWR